MHLDKITYLAATDARGKEQAFGIKTIDRAKHMYVIGKTGMGKSTLLENMAIQDIQNGEGLAFIDPHGSTAEKLLDYVPEHRIKDVVYFAPFDMESPVAFNVMEDVGYDKRHLVVSGLIGAFKKIWPDVWSARMEYVLTNVLLALLEYPDSTLLDVNRMLSNKIFRNKVIKNITDPMVRSYWTEEYAGYTERFAAEMIPAIQNKVGQFTSNPLIRNIIGQPESSFNLREMMDDKKIFIANLSKGQMGEINASLIGSLLTTKIYLSAMSRADEGAQKMSKLPPFYFYVDEFQSVANDSFADILSEARKYKLALIIAHQYVAQMEEGVRDAVFGNVGTTIVFRVGPFDAEVLETIFKPKFYADDLVSLGFAQIYLTLMIDGVGSPPFSAKTLPPIDEPEMSFREQVLQNSRQMYGTPRELIEEAIKVRNEADQPQKPAPKKQDSSKGGDRGGDKEGKKNESQNKKYSSQQSSNQGRQLSDSERNSTKRPESKTDQNKVQEREDTKNNNKAGPLKRTISLNTLKVKNRDDGKGPSADQLSALRKALVSVQKTVESSTQNQPQHKTTYKQKPKETQLKPRHEHQSKETSREPSNKTKNKTKNETPKEVPKEVLENILKDNK